MFRQTVVKTALSLWLAVLLTAPAALWAKEGAAAPTAPASAPQIPVLLEAFPLDNGQTGYIAEAPVPLAQEHEFVKRITAKNRGQVTLAVDSPSDPALEAALESGNPAWVNSFIAASVDRANVLNDAKVKPSFSQRLKNKIKSIATYCKDQKYGLMTAFFTSAASTGYIMYQSASVSAGMKAFIGIFAWSAFQSMNSKGWEWYLDKGGEAFTKILSWAVGRDVTEIERHLSDVAGKFHASWITNSALVAYIFYSSGTFHGLNAAGLMQALYFGFLASTDILDAIVSQKVKEGVFAASLFVQFIIARIVASSGLEIAGYFNEPPHVQTALFLTTLGALVYLATNHYVDAVVGSQLKKIGLKTRGLASHLKGHCNALLTKHAQGT
jgi:hypothetical protein